jgi:hypothetical protein
MTFTFKLSRRIARFRAPVSAAVLLTLAGCSATDSLEPESSPPVLSSTGFAGGIPFGVFALPTGEFDDRYDGSMRIIYPQFLLKELAGIKARGGRLALNLAGGQRTFTDASGHFSLTLWKERVARFKGVDFSAYVNDGTIIGHYLIDEPNDPSNWNGTPIPGSTLDEMARYSKQLWPGMATIVRTYPDYLAQWSGTYQYLDAAWAQYVDRKGPADEFIAHNVAQAKAKGLALIVGLNILQGGPGGAAMTASQVESWGTALLSSTYPCAFISWKYDAGYLSSAAIQRAMDVLRARAKDRSTASCGGSPTAPPPPEPPSAPSSATGTLPFGLAFAPAQEYSTGDWTGTQYRASPADLVQRLGQARSAGMRIVVMLASKRESRNTDGSFSLTRWKAAVDRYRSLSLGSYVSDGTFYLHHLVDQPNCPSCWGGKAISWETVEEMARYSKSIWPALPTSVRVPPSKLAAASFRWAWLDAGGINYNAGQGDLRKYLAGQVAQAKSEGLGLVVGLNLVDAAGYGTAPMTASQIRQFGTIPAQEPSACALVGWSYDADYVGQSGIRGALDSVATVARARAAPSCVVS